MSAISIRRQVRDTLLIGAVVILFCIVLSWLLYFFVVRSYWAVVGVSLAIIVLYALAAFWVARRVLAGIDAACTPLEVGTGVQPDSKKESPMPVETTTETGTVAEAGQGGEPTAGPSTEAALNGEYGFVCTILDTTGALVVVVDQHGQIIRFNRACEQTTGYSFDEVKGQYIWDMLLVPEEVEPAMATFERLRAGEFPLQYESHWVTKDGKRRLIAWSSTVLLDSKEKPGYIIGVGLDVTGRTEGAAERDEHWLMLRALLDKTPDIIIFKDQRYAFRACSQTIARLLGKKEDELVGKTDFDLWPAEEAQPFWEEERRVIEGGEDIVSEHLLATAQGQRWFEAVKMPLRDEKGQVIGLLSTERDITRRKQAEEALRRERDFADGLLDTAPVIVLALDTGGRIVRFNRYMEDLSGYTLDEVQGKDWIATFVPVHDRDRVRELFSKAVGGVATQGNVNAILTRDGREIHVEWFDKALKDDDGNTVGLLAIGVDITEREKAEAERDEQRRMLRTMLETTPDIVLFKDRNSVFRACSKLYSRLQGKPLEEIIGKTDFDFFPLEDARQYQAEEVQVMGTGEPLTAEHLLDTPWGKRWYDVIKMPLLDEQGLVVGLISTERDITERKEAVEALAKRERYLAALVEVQHALLVFRADESLYPKVLEPLGRVSGASRVYVFENHRDPAGRLLMSQRAEWVAEGIPPEIDNLRLQGLSYDEFFPRWAEVLAQGGVVAGVVADFPESERLILEPQKILSILVLPLIVRGEFFGFIGFDNCVEARAWESSEMDRLSLAAAVLSLAQERRLAEEELERQYGEAERARSETRATLDAASDAMMVLSPGLEFVSTNKRFGGLFYGGRPPDLVGHSLQEFVGEQDRIFVDSAGLRKLVMDMAVDPEREFKQVVAQRWPQERELEMFSTPVRRPAGEYLGRLYVFRDVTHEREVDRMKSEFVSLVSHELRTPLTSIKGYIDLLLDGEAGDLTDEQKEFLGIVKINADRLVALISDMLDVSRIESGRVELNRAVLDVAALIRGVATSLRPQIEARKQTLALELADDLPSVLGDADRVTQIMTNLLSNAYKYTPVEGSITVAAQAEGDHVRVDVRDTGVGMTPEEQAKLFTKFFRAKNRATQEAGGTGLGLVITRSLVQMHGGEITVASTPGQGSTFSFTLPTTEKVAESKPVPVEQEAQPQVAQPGRRILVVDDERDIANLIRRYLEHAGYEVLLAYNAAEALRLAQVEHPDLITLDILLPGADGFTFMEWLKNDPATSNIPVVLVSMMPDDGHGKLLGAVDYLTKPMSEQVLLQRVGRILASDKSHVESHVVLVADDDDGFRALIAGYLSRAGYQVLEAQNGAEAVALSQLELPGVVLLDIKMPVMDGITALRALREDEDTRSLPVVMMTASPGLLDESRPTIEALGAYALLSKPFTAQELAQVIAQGLTGRRQA